MNLIQIMRRSVSSGLVYPFQRVQPRTIRFLSSFIPGDWNYSTGRKGTNPSESIEEFEKRIFANNPESSSKSDEFLNTLDNIEKDRDGKSGFDANMGEGNYESFYQSGGNFNTLSDGMEHKLKRAATYFEFSPDEIAQEGYAYRPDHNFQTDKTYELKDLDIKKPSVRQFPRKIGVRIKNKIAIMKADFRNARFLANFISEAGLILPRTQTKLSKLAQRKVARAIRYSRCFGLMPFTTQGTKAFVFGRSMENHPSDFEYTTFGGPSSE